MSGFSHLPRRAKQPAAHVVTYRGCSHINEEKRMGLMDRDYMHEKRPRQTFTTVPEKSATNTLFMVLVFVAALFLLYKLADWQLSKRASNLAAQAAPSIPLTPRQPGLGQNASTMPLTREPRSALPHYPEAPEATEASETTTGNRIVTKCTVNGKTSYGDGPCASGATPAQVTTRTDQNILQPVRLSAHIEPEAAFSPAPAVIAQNAEPSNYAAKKIDCESLDARIQYLDSLGRQPQSGQTMDWIKDERKKARDRQFRIPCR
jgi:hypothetical protein